jgi:hypothetical protein
MKSYCKTSPSTGVLFVSNLASRLSNEARLTPIRAQYRRIKGELPKDALSMVAKSTVAVPKVPIAD